MPLKDWPRVGARICRDGQHFKGSVGNYAIDGTFSILWDALKELGLPQYRTKGFNQTDLRTLTHLCRHCDSPLYDHADNGKCLYSPTYYEE